MNGPHPSHKLRWSDAGSFDSICENCNRTDGLGTWGKLAEPCPAVPQSPVKIDIALHDGDASCNFCGKDAKEHPGRILVHESGNAICADCIAAAVLSLANYAQELLTGEKVEDNDQG